VLQPLHSAKLGDASKAGPWVDHVRKVYPHEADHLFKWFAQRVQHPEIKVNHAIMAYCLAVGGVSAKTLCSNPSSKLSARRTSKRWDRWRLWAASIASPNL
jgi:hypothetical protein